MACPQAPPLLDLFHWLLYEPLLADMAPARLLERVLKGEDGQHLISIAARLRCPLPPVVLLLLYLVDWISRLELEQLTHKDEHRARQISRLHSMLRDALVLKQAQC